MVEEKEEEEGYSAFYLDLPYSLETKGVKRNPRGGYRTGNRKRYYFQGISHFTSWVDSMK
ncbi:hypothetical protein V6O07_00400 [Arthrospira platensis SPKY2]